MLLDATRNFDRPLTAERLFGWHAALFPTGYSGLNRITVGAWRTDETEPMQVVSGPPGRERVHFQAPTAARIELEMKRFLEWFPAPAIDPVLKAGVAQFWFVTIHPFADGNGRIGRAIAELALAQADGTQERYYSMSSAIAAQRDQYYRRLEAAQQPRHFHVARVVPGLPRPQHPRSRPAARLGAVQSETVAEDQSAAGERQAASDHQPAARGIPGSSHDVEVRQARQVLERHRATRHQRPARTRHHRSQPGKRTQYQLPARRLGAALRFCRSVSRRTGVVSPCRDRYSSSSRCCGCRWDSSSRCCCAASGSLLDQVCGRGWRCR